MTEAIITAVVHQFKTIAVATKTERKNPILAAKIFGALLVFSLMYPACSFILLLNQLNGLYFLFVKPRI